MQPDGAPRRAVEPIRLHASAVVIHEAGVLIRGESGVGKTGLALALLREADRARCFGRLVADDTVLIAACHDRILAHPHPRTAGLVERRGIGITPIDHEPACVLRLVVDLVAGAAMRHPDPESLRTILIGVELPRLALPAALGSADLAGRVFDFVATFRQGS